MTGEAGHEGRGVRGTVGLAPGEQPSTVGEARGDAAGSAVGELGDQLGQWWRDEQAVAAEGERDGRVGGGGDVVEGELGDGAGALAVEQHEESGDPVGGRDRRVGEQAPAGGPAVLVVEEVTGQLVGRWGGRGECGQVLAAGPVEEDERGAGVGDGGQGGVELGLGGVGEVAPGVVERGEQARGRGDLAAGAVGGGRACGRVLGAGAEAAQQLPGEVGAQQGLVGGVVERVDGGVGVGVHSGEPFVAFGQRAGGDEESA
ncbi:hypothetical protein ACU61A_37295 [Pseudonocardia sichuanensis]|uniref:hypothetical protein n=1 Tax=Pseudonocardia kunmingensis TaxID=630975 RepID=UPI00114FBBB4|nr:hypothetical protein [Pseudonocardia kunmingensis]